MGDVRNSYKTVVGKHEGKRPLGRTTRRWEDNIGMGLRETGSWLIIGTSDGLV